MMSWHKFLLLVLLVMIIPLASADLKTDLEQWYTFDNGTVNSEQDSAGSGIHLNWSINSCEKLPMIQGNGLFYKDNAFSRCFVTNEANSPIDGNDIRTMALWGNASVDSGVLRLLAGQLQANGYSIFVNSSSILVQSQPSACSFLHGLSISQLSESNLYLVEYNGSHNNMYLNNQFKGSCTASLSTTSSGIDLLGRGGFDSNRNNGSIDEFRYYSRILTSQEKLQIYSMGTSSENDVSVNLLSPEDNQPIDAGGVNFTAEYTLITQTLNLTNATYFIWFDNSTLFNQTTVDITGMSNQTSILFGDFPIGNFEWNVMGCAQNSSESFCNISQSNFSFSSAFSIINQSFNNNSFETESQRFEINISTLDDILNVFSFLVYDNVSYTATTSCESGICNIKRTIDIPLVNSGESEFKNWTWDITVFDGTMSLNTVIPVEQQNVTRVHLEECDATYTVQSLNYTAYDERTTARLDPYQFEGTFFYWLGNGTVRQNVSVNQPSITEIDMCIDPPDRQFMIDSDITYGKNSNYVNTDYHQQQDIISNTSKDIFLYLLDSEFATTFILKVQDINLQPIQDSLIQIQRYYPEENIFRVVQVAKTDDNGETVGFYETETIDYKHTIIRNNTILLATGQGKIVGKNVPFTLTFTVGEGFDVPYSVFISDPNLFTNLTYNKITGMVTFTWIDLDGQASSGRLLVEQPQFGRTQTTTICDQTLNFPTGTINCNVTNYNGTIIANGFVTKGSTVLTDLINFVISNAIDILDKTGLIMAWFIILTSCMVFLWNPTAGIVAINSTIIFTNIIGLATFNPIFIFSIMGVSIIAIILLRT